MALRLGQEVHLVFGGLEEEMNVSHEDLKDALDEGLKLYAPFEFLNIVGNHQDCVEGVCCRRLEIIEGKENLSLAPAQEDPIVLSAQTVILAHGQKTNTFLASVTPQLKLNSDATFYRDEQTSMSSLEKTFTVASAAKGPMTVVQAFAEGKSLTKTILRAG